MVYTSVQFISYEIYTAPEISLQYGGVIKQAYKGLTNSQDDLQARISLVDKVLKEIEPLAKRQEDTLKIFMMPEFFFRGSKGAYEMDHVQTIIESLETLVNDKMWEHWLFIFGTIVGFSQDTNNKKEVYNFSLVQKGGIKNTNNDIYQTINSENSSQMIGKRKPPEFVDKSDTSRKKVKTSTDQKINQDNLEKKHIVLKKDMSSTDFIDYFLKINLPLNPLNPLNLVNLVNPPESLVSGNVHHLEPFQNPNNLGQNEYKTFDGSSVFSFGGITFGLEICLDHAQHRLKKLNNPGIDIQLIISCGMNMDIINDAIAARANGYVFLCDGLNPHTQVLKVLKKNNSFFYKKLFPSIDNDTTLEKLTKVMNIDNIQVNSSNICINDIYPRGSGRVLVCKPCELPESLKLSQSSSITQSLFPDTTSSFSLAMPHEPILLNGMKVLFDNPTPTTPVTLQPKQRGTNNGR